MSRHLVPFEPAFAGRYWDNEREIDWVILDRNRTHAVAVEVKWTRTPEHASRLAEELRAKVRAVPALSQCKATYVLVSRAGFKNAKDATPCVMVSLKDEKC